MPISHHAVVAQFFIYPEDENGKWEERALEGILACEDKENARLAEQRRYPCPACGKHTLLWLLPTTRIRDLPVKCKRCGKVSLVNICPEPQVSGTGERA